MIDEELYQLATDELNSDQRRPDIWARACALASDDHDEARYLYTNLRVEQLIAERARPRTALSTADNTEFLSDLDTPANGTGALEDDQAVLELPEAESHGVDGRDSPVIELPDTDTDARSGSSSPAVTQDVSLQDITTHDFQVEDLTPDDFAAGTIDMSGFDDADTTASEHPLPQEEPGHSMPEPLAEKEDTPSGSDKATSSYWDDDDFSFELEPLDTPAKPSDEQSEKGLSDTSATAEASSTRSGIDADSTARLTESDLASFSTDSLSDDSETSQPSAAHISADRATASAAPADSQADDVLSAEEPDDQLDATHELPLAARRDMQLDDAALDAPPQPSPAPRRKEEHREDQREHPSEDQTNGVGRSWLVYRRGQNEMRAVKQGVCWPALIVTLPWLLGKMLLGTALVYSVLWLVLVAGFLVSGLAWLDAGSAAPLLTPLLFAGFTLLILVGLFYVPFRHANSWHARKLERRGFSILRQVNAHSAAAAVNHVQAYRQH